MTGVNGASIRERNLIAVLARLRSLGTASRSELADAVGLDRSTMTSISTILLDAGLVEPVAQAPSGSRGGRRAELLSVDQSRFVVAGCDITSGGARWVVADLRGQIVDQGSLGPSLPAAGDTVRLQWLASLLDDCVAAVAGSSHGRRVVGAGIALPGLLDRTRHRVVESFDLGLRAVELPMTRLGPDVRPDYANDATCYAWHAIAAQREATAQREIAAQRVATEERRTTDGLYVFTKLHRDGERFRPTAMGVGLVSVVGGSIVRGANGSAGELRGYRWQPGVADQLGVDLERLRSTDGEEAALVAAAEELGRNLTVVASVLDPGRIVVAGDLVDRDAAAAAVGRTLRPADRLEIARADGIAVATGAAEMVLDRLFTGRDWAGDAALSIVSMVG